jgi:hypothetical protein
MRQPENATVFGSGRRKPAHGASPYRPRSRSTTDRRLLQMLHSGASTTA